MSDRKIRTTVYALVVALTEWERRYREEPERFMSEYVRFTTLTPASYGENAARYLVALLDEAQGSV